MTGHIISFSGAAGGVVAVGGTPPVWSPADIAGLYSWYDFSALGLANGAAVGSAPDLSGLAHNIAQGVAGDKPGYATNAQNGLGVTTYANDGRLLTGSGWDEVVQTRGLFAGVLKFSNYLGQQGAYYAGNGTAYAAVLQAYFGTLTMQFNGVSANTAAGSGSYALYLGYYDGSKTTLRINGVQIVQSSVSAQPGRAISTIQVGANVAQSYKYEGRTGEILQYARASTTSFTTEEIAAIEAYLMTKWGLS